MNGISREGRRNPTAPLSAARTLLLAAGLLAIASTQGTAGSLSTEVEGFRAELTSTPQTPRAGQETTYSLYLIATKPFVALAVVALGTAQMADIRMPSLAVSTGIGRRALPIGPAVFLYGFGYALASTGCTLPLYVSITVLPLTSGFSGAALLTFLAFAAAMALMMLATTLLVGLAKQRMVGVLQRSAVWVKRASGLVLVVAGLYLGYYYLAAGM